MGKHLGVPFILLSMAHLEYWNLKRLTLEEKSREIKSKISITFLYEKSIENSLGFSFSEKN